jgi:hypothetical protein
MSPRSHAPIAVEARLTEWKVDVPEHAPKRKKLRHMSPGEWLQYHRARQGYTPSRIPESFLGHLRARLPAKAMAIVEAHSSVELAAMERMHATPEEKTRIYGGNARRLLRLRLA